MERRGARVSERQWNIALDFMECNPNLTRARRYNNSSRGRAESFRQWSQLAALLNAERSGPTKTPKEWSIYVSNFKSKLKRTVADLNAVKSETGGGPPGQGQLSDMELRFLSLMGEGFDQSFPGVAVDLVRDMNQQTTAPATEDQVAEQPKFEVLVIEGSDMLNEVNASSDEPHVDVTVTPTSAETETLAPSPTPADGTSVLLPRRIRRARYRSRPLAPTARRVLSRAVLQRAAAAMANAQANNLIAQNLGRLASAVERYLGHIGVP